MTDRESMLFIGLGEARMGMRKVRDGVVVEETAATWTSSPNGGTVMVGTLDPETMEPTGDNMLFGDWDAAGYLSEVLRLLKPHRAINLPDFKTIIHDMYNDGSVDFCEYCKNYYNCRDCVVAEWKMGSDDD